tara:strand:+ start:5173 stop:6966 length:1794 start_codon:yes stop_codon:yes gene_type:complete
MLKLLKILGRRERTIFTFVLAVMLLIGFTQLIGIGALLPFITLLADPEQLQQNSLLSWSYEAFDFESSRVFLVFVGGIALSALVLSNVVLAIGLFIVEKYARGMQHKLSVRLFEGYLSRPYAFFLKGNSNDLSRNVLIETGILVEGVVLPTIQILTGTVTSVFIFGFILWLNPVMTLIVIGVMGISFTVVYLIIQKVMTSYGEKRFVANSIRFRSANESFTGLKDLKVLGRQEEYQRRFRNSSRKYTNALVIESLSAQLPRFLVETIAFGGILIIVLYLLLAGSEFKDIVIFASIFSFAGFRTLPALQQIYRASAKLKFTKIVADTLIGDLQEDRARLDTPAEHSGDINFEHFVKLENINFSYSERNSEALQNVSMQINKGSFVAIVGRTGSGKTTLVDLLLGLLEPDSGELSVDEIQINQSNAPMWRRQVGYVPQQIFLADDTLSANIALGIPEQLVDQEKVERAAQIAQVNEFIDQLPQGFATFLGERGVRLSGGQRQRVGLARAIYSSPSVLILDEATSSLDSITERAVMSAVHHLKGEMTTIVVAHRLSTVMNSDEIFIFDSGALVESGQYQQLLKTSELFKDLASQFEDATD